MQCNVSNGAPPPFGSGRQYPQRQQGQRRRHPPPRDYRLITTQSRHDHGAITTRSRHDHGTITARSRRDHGAATAASGRRARATATRLPRNRGRPLLRRRPSFRSHPAPSPPLPPHPVRRAPGPCPGFDTRAHTHTSGLTRTPVRGHPAYGSR